MQSQAPGDTLISDLEGRMFQTRGGREGTESGFRFVLAVVTIQIKAN